MTYIKPGLEMPKNTEQQNKSVQKKYDSLKKKQLTM